jgi:hypothetical protein
MSRDPAPKATKLEDEALRALADPHASLPVRIARVVLVNRAQWLLTLGGGVVLAFAGLILSIAWQIGPEVALRHSDYARFTAHADARIVESWLALEVDLESIRNPANWRASALATPCVVVELSGDWGGARQRAFCGNRFGFNDAYDIPFLADLAPKVPFAWSRDERGFALPEIRVARPTLEWLGHHQVDTFMHQKWPVKNALDWLSLEADRPVDLAIAGWSNQPQSLPVVYDPANTASMYPKGIIDARLAVTPSWILTAVIGAIGLVVWWFGMQLLPVIANFNPVGRVIFTLLPLLALPWFADYLPVGLSVLNRPMASVVRDMLGDVDPLDRLVATAPGDALLAHGERIAWRAGDGVYAGTFGQLEFKPPKSMPLDADAALTELARQASAQIRALEPAERAALFDRARRDKVDLDLKDGALVIVPAARDALVATDPDPAVRRAAARFLGEWVTAPTLVVDPHLPAVRERAAIWQSLADVPVPEIANMVTR